MVHGCEDPSPLKCITAYSRLLKVAALRGYENANGMALDLWETVYPDGPLIALTDTFSTESFYKVRIYACGR